jgi:hypothetical protein
MPGEDGDSPFFLPGPPGLSAGAWVEFTKDLGVARRSGTFDVTGFSGLTVGAPVLVVQTDTAIASKGNATDEGEMNTIVVTAYALTTSSIRCFWYSDAVQVGTYAFAATPNLAGTSAGSSVAAYGRPQPAGGGYFNIPGSVPGANQTSTFFGIDTDWYAPWYTPTQITIDQLAFEVTIAGAGGSVVRIGFYAADTNWQPTGAPLADSGDINTQSTGVKTYTPGSAIVVPAGRYLSVYNSGVSDPQVTAFRSMVPGAWSINASLRSQRNWRVTRAHAAFPNPGTAWDTVTQDDGGTTYAQVAYRISVP